jgi:hypothetical protein
MKLTRIAFVLAALPALFCSAEASASMDDIKAADNQVGIQGTMMHLDYTETGNGFGGTPIGTVDTENGNVYGYNLTYSSLSDWFLGNDYLAIQYGQNNGNTEYVGQYIGGSVNNYGSVVTTSAANTTDYSMRYGKAFELGKTLAIPYLEIGYHEWFRGINEGETYEHSYYALGGMFQFSPADKLVLTVDAFLGKTHSASIHVPIASVYSYSGTLGNFSIGHLSATLDYAFTTHIHGMVGADYTEYKYGISEPDGFGIFEPDSKTQKTMYRIGIGYAF